MAHDAIEQIISAQIEREFSFLLDLGFTVLADDEAEHRWVNADGVFVRVFFSSNEGYVGFRIGTAASPSDALTATELALLEGNVRPSETTSTSESELERQVVGLAQLLQLSGQRALAGDPEIFERARELRRQHTRRFIK